MADDMRTIQQENILTRPRQRRAPKPDDLQGGDAEYDMSSLVDAMYPDGSRLSRGQQRTLERLNKSSAVLEGGWKSK